jgi:hypothetical protein
MYLNMRAGSKPGFGLDTGQFPDPPNTAASGLPPIASPCVCNSFSYCHSWSHGAGDGPRSGTATPRTRLESLLDAGSSTLLTPEDDSGMLAAMGQVHSTQVVAVSTDGTIQGGARLGRPAPTCCSLPMTRPSSVMSR